MEFAFIATPFIAMIVAIIESVMTQYYSSALDHAVQKLASDLRSGAAMLGVDSSTTTAMTAQGVKDKLAPFLPTNFDPNKLQVKLVSRNCNTTTQCWRSEYSVYAPAVRQPPAFDPNPSLPFSIGAAGDSQYLTVYYPAPSLSAIWSTAATARVNGENVFGILSTAMWTNDPSVGVFGGAR